MFMFSKQEYDSMIRHMKKASNEVNGTYELVGTSERFFGDTQRIKEMFGISDEFEHEFIKAITNFEKKVIGPYITEKYFLMIPALKESMRHLTDDCLETRRCVIHFPEEHCFQSIQFLLRENTVNVTCYMRSCDAIKNFPYDMWICSKLADIFSHYLEIMQGIHPYSEHIITMMFGSLHVYKEDVKDVF